MTKPNHYGPANLARIALVSLFIVAIFIALASPAHADVVFTNFGTAVCGGDPGCIAFNGINGGFDGVAGATQTFDHGDIEMIAGSFFSSGNFSLSDVMLPLMNLQHGTADVYLTTNSAGVPGAVLESWLGIAGTAVPPTNVTTLNSVLNPALTSGTEYWLVVGPSTSDSDVGWNYTWDVAATNSNSRSNGTPGMAGIPLLTGPWGPHDNTLTNAFQIDGTPNNTPPPTPEPGTLSLLGAGFLGLVATFRRKGRV